MASFCIGVELYGNARLQERGIVAYRVPDGIDVVVLVFQKECPIMTKLGSIRSQNGIASWQGTV